MATPGPFHPSPITITDLLKRLASTPQHVQAEEIALAFSRIFEDRLSPAQVAALLTLLHSTKLDRHPQVIAQCAARMREAASQVDRHALQQTIGKRKRTHGNYHGGLCDIVGTGGDSHSTFNISTTASIIASPLLLIAKHGNRAQTSMSGSADVLNAISPRAPHIAALNAQNLPGIYEYTNYVFLFAPNFHPGMKYAATVRRELGLRTIFNVLGPLANPVDWALEARVLGVAQQQYGPVFAQALRMSGAGKCLVVCGEEDLDEISCAGKTNCWMIQDDSRGSATAETQDGEEENGDEEEQYLQEPVQEFQLTPEDFGLARHALSEVGGGKLAKENAGMLMRILRNELEADHPILHFVLMNVAALFVVSGICEADECHTGEVIKERGPGGGRWKEGVRKARWCVESGEAVRQLDFFIEHTNRLC